MPARAIHVRSIARRMRQADRDELRASSGRQPADALIYSMRRSRLAYTALINGVPEVMFGAGDLNILAQSGAPWLLGTDAVPLHYVAFLRGSVRWRGQLLRRYAVLRNLVDDRNHTAMRWLRWLGFRLSDPVIAGVEQRPFRVFELRREDV